MRGDPSCRVLTVPGGSSSDDPCGWSCSLADVARWRRAASVYIDALQPFAVQMQPEEWRAWMPLALWARDVDLDPWWVWFPRDDVQRSIAVAKIACQLRQQILERIASTNPSDPQEIPGSGSEGSEDSGWPSFPKLPDFPGLPSFAELEAWLRRAMPWLLLAGGVYVGLQVLPLVLAKKGRRRR